MQEFSDDDWHIDQVVQEPTGEEAMCSQHGYGFANLHKGLLNKYQVFSDNNVLLIVQHEDILINLIT